MNEALRDELTAMKQRDHDMRDQLLHEGWLHGDYPEELQRIHTENAHRMNELVDRAGWPTLSQVLLEGTRSA